MCTNKQGTGFIEDSDGHVLTCMHVVAHKVDFLRSGNHEPEWISGRVTAELPDGTRIAATLVAADASLDIALLKLHPSSGDPPFALKPLLFAPHLPEVGEPVFCIGHPTGIPYACRFGFLSNQRRSLSDFPEDFLNCMAVDLKKMDPDFSYLDLDLRGAPGLSGAGLCNQDGNVFGVLNGGSPHYTFPGALSTYGVPLARIQDFIGTQKKRTGGIFVHGRRISS